MDGYHYHYDPEDPFSGYSLPRKSPYSGTLTELSGRTAGNLQRLRETLAASDPCYEYGLQHWHSDQRKYPDPEPQFYPPHATPNWESTQTVFTSRSGMDRLGWKKEMSEVPEDNSSNGTGVPVCYLCSTLEEHQRHLAKRGIQLKEKKTPRPRVEFIAPPPLVRKKKEEEGEELKERLYRVTVKTSSKPNAATSANVFMKVRGTHGTLRRRQLIKKMSVQFSFGRGTSEVFHIKGPILGDLQYLTIEHDGIEQKHSWLLDEIEIKDMASEVIWIFPCKQWLSLYIGEGDLKKQLKAYVKEIEQIGPWLRWKKYSYREIKFQHEYEIVVDTGTKPRSGTTANVFLTMYGKNGATPKLKLSNKKEEAVFSKGKKDTFHHVVDDLGPIVRCRIEHDDTGESPDWFLEKIAIEDLDDPNRCYIFPCGQWLSSEREECMTYRELYPVTRKMALMHARKLEKMKGQTLMSQKRENSEAESTRYEVTVVTGNRRYAGTDANIYMEIVGKHGKTGELKLDDHKNNFEKGQTDVFKIEAAEVGNIKRVRIRHDNSGLGAGWYLEQMKIKKYFTKSEILHRLSQVEAQKEEELAERLEKEERRSGSPTILKHRKSSTVGSDSDDEKKRRNKKRRDSSSEDEYDGYGRKIRKDKRGKKYKSKYEHSSDEEYERRRGKGRKKYRSESEDSEEDGKRRGKRKGKRLMKYNGIEQWVTDSEDEEDRRGRRQSSKYSSKYDDSDDEKKHRRRKKYDDSDSDYEKKRKGKSGGKRDDSSDEYEHKNYRRKSKVRFHDQLDSEEERKIRRRAERRKKNKYRSDSESSDSDSDDRKSKKRKDRRKNKNRFDSSESDTDSDDRSGRGRKGKNRRRRGESSSEESDASSDESLSDVRAYTTWKKDRIPYCDEYVLPCGKWLATDEDDGKTERELRPDTVTTFYRLPPAEPGDRGGKKKHRRR